MTPKNESLLEWENANMIFVLLPEVSTLRDCVPNMLSKPIHLSKGCHADIAQTMLWHNRNLLGQLFTLEPARRLR